jgi:hypothetical protein
MNPQQKFGPNNIRRGVLAGRLYPPTKGGIAALALD